MRQKDGITYTNQQIRRLHPQISFAANTYTELGYLPYTPPPHPPATLEQVQHQLTNAVQRHLDAKAIEKGYDNIVSACSYAAVPNLFQAEGIAFINWRSDVWAHCYGVMQAVQDGIRSVPTETELIAELPVYVP